jgi:predicted metalloprotease
MKWDGNRESDNVEDRRGDSGGGGFGGRSVGIGTIAVALLASYFFGINPMTVISLLSGGGGGGITPTQQAPAKGPPANDTATRFVRVVLADTEDVWTAQFRSQGGNYVKSTLVLFSGRTSTRCGQGESATGPFYCPADQKIYIDLSFYQLMRERFKVEGEFAQAYVIAHEVGHHVQNLMGISSKVDAARRGATQTRANALSVRMELQADCFAGVWAFHANEARAILERGDVETALNAASAIGDDALQRQAQGQASGQVTPDSFTHGTSAQRVRWFKRGIASGVVTDCDTFKVRQL